MLGDAHEIGAALHMEGLLIDVVGLGHLTSVGSENGDVAAIGIADGHGAATCHHIESALGQLLYAERDAGLVAEG